MNNDQNNNIGNWIDIIALIVGIQNLAENRQQSAYNDVQKANNSQAEYLLSEINRRFDEQNEILAEQNRKLDRLIEVMEGKFDGKY